MLIWYHLFQNWVHGHLKYVSVFLFNKNVLCLVVDLNSAPELFTMSVHDHENKSSNEISIQSLWVSYVTLVWYREVTLTHTPLELGCCTRNPFTCLRTTNQTSLKRGTEIKATQRPQDDWGLLQQQPQHKLNVTCDLFRTPNSFTLTIIHSKTRSNSNCWIWFQKCYMAVLTLFRQITGKL